MLRDWRQALLDLLFPPKCPVCKKRVATHGTWCPVCKRQVLVPREVSVAGHHMAFLERCMAVCEYTGGLKRLIHDLKFRRKAAAAAYLVALLEEGFRQEWLVGVDAVVPVPLHSARLAERGYNQTELIFRPWAKRHNLVWLGDALVRSRETVPQWELPLKERKKNLQGAFAVIRPGLVAGRHILLVDDIITGGVTMNECARVLKKAGAARVSGLALASGARQ